MPKSSDFLSGILAGINSYKQTRQWMEQMEQNKLQTEKMRMGNEMYQTQMGDYESPDVQRQKSYDLQTRIDADRRANQPAPAQPTEPWRPSGPAPQGYEYYEYEPGKWKIARTDFNKGGQTTAAPKEAKPQQLKIADAMKIADGIFSAYGIEGNPQALPSYPAVLELVKNGDIGGAQAKLRTYQFATSDENKWLSQLPDGFTYKTTDGQDVDPQDYIEYLATQGATDDDIRAAFADMCKQAEQSGYIKPKTDYIGKAKKIAVKATEKVGSIQDPNIWR